MSYQAQLKKVTKMYFIPEITVWRWRNVKLRHRTQRRFTWR